MPYTAAVSIAIGTGWALYGLFTAMLGDPASVYRIAFGALFIGFAAWIKEE